MSKTDKTRPAWVKEFFEGTIHHDHKKGRCVVESFEDAVKVHGEGWRKFNPDVTCERRHHHMRYSVMVAKVYGQTVPREARNMHHNTSRMDERMTLREAARDYNTHGETDLNMEDNPHRHSASWFYW